jgi:hypothetical protein
MLTDLVLSSRRDMINPSGNVPDELVDAVKREMQQNPATQSAQVDDGKRFCRLYSYALAVACHILSISLKGRSHMLMLYPTFNRGDQKGSESDGSAQGVGGEGGSWQQVEHERHRGAQGP